MVRAPFELHIVPTDTAHGQAAGEKWYIAPFCLWRRWVYSEGTRRRLHISTITKLSFDYARNPSQAQHIGTQLWYAGRSTWRQL